MHDLRWRPAGRPFEPEVLFGALSPAAAIGMPTQESGRQALRIVRCIETRPQLWKWRSMPGLLGDDGPLSSVWRAVLALGKRGGAREEVL